MTIFKCVNILSLSVFDHPKNYRHFSTLPNVFNNVAILQYQDFSKLFKSKLCLVLYLCGVFSSTGLCGNCFQFKLFQKCQCSSLSRYESGVIFTKLFDQI